MYRFIRNFSIIAIIFGMLGLFFTGCELLEGVGDVDDEYGFGWFGSEDLDNIENDISFGSGSIPTEYSLLNNFPPIGNQGSYGTCVAWATGYNHRSYINALEKGYTTSDMNDANKVFSPKYLFWAIPSGQKGSGCGGTGFESAYEVMLDKGIATQSETPYTDLGDCSGSTSSWDSEAANHKMQSYREINLDKETLKEYLASNRAISFGAKLGDAFMSWSSSDVLYDDTDTYNGQHAYHAMILSGYDDNVGNGAFRVVNSWGTNWGDNGYIWVDQDFFVNNFAFCAFVGTSGTDPDEDGDDQVDDPTDGIDLVGWELDDLDNGGDVNRIAKYNVFNSGTIDILASERWNIIYLAYNAFDANDFEILLYDYYSDEYGSLGENGDLNEDGDGVENWWNNVNVSSGASVAEAVYGDENGRFSWPYEMPTSLNGEYYLVLIADGYDVLSEANEDNNYFFLTDSNGEPITIINGVIQDELASSTKSGTPQRLFEDSPMPTTVSNNNLNAYTSGEILTMIKHRKETGEIARKAAMHSSKGQHSKKKN